MGMSMSIGVSDCHESAGWNSEIRNSMERKERLEEGALL